MFGRKEPEKRSLEDMFAPKGVDIADEAESEVDFGSVECEKAVEVENFANDPIKPLDCFGMEEEKTEKWLLKCAKFWFCCMSFIWFLFGATTFAPVIYISNKVNVIFKNKKKSFLFAAGLYGFSILIFVIVIMFN